jgi:hypothetical protein
VFDDKKSLLCIYDYKFGHGYVDVMENWQLIEYAAGILDFLKIKETITVQFFIVQPRCYHPEGQVRVWTILSNALEKYFDTLRMAEYEAMQVNALCKVSPQCKNCRARHACPTLQRSALDAVDISYQNIPFNLTPEQLGHELKLLHRSQAALEARIAGLESEATSTLKRGKHVPNYTLAQGQGKTAWSIPVEAVAALLGNKVKKPIEVVTPKQAIKLKIEKEVVDGFSEYIPGAFKLTPADTTTTRKLFGSK